MGRYKILIEKREGMIPAKVVTRVEVIGFLRTVKTLSPDLPTQGLDVDGNPTGGTNSLPPSSDQLVRLASFEVTDPVARFIKIVTCSSPDSSPCLIWEGISTTDAVNSESVHVLHKRKSAGRVRSFYEATSELLKKKGQELDSPSEMLEGVESDEEGDMSGAESIPKGKLSTFRVDLHELKNPGKVILRVDTDKDLVDYEGGTTVITVLNLDDENGNSEQIEVPEHVQGKEPKPSDQSNGEIGHPSSETEPDETKTVVGEAMAQEELDMETPTLSPVTMTLTVANDLMILVELDNNFESVDDGVSKGQSDVEPVESSTQSLVEPDTLFYLPYQNVFLDGLPKGRNKTQRIPSYLEEKDTPERVERKKLLRKLILERLLAFGTPNVTALDITDTWYSGYVQHRALSYRIPRMRVAAKTNEDEGQGKKDPPKPVQIKIGTRLPDSAGFIENFIYHANFFKGILNGATCTALECTFYLMLPHFMTHTEKNSNHFPGAGISPSFVRDWISLITSAAYQLKPAEPGAIADLVKKEAKLMKNLLGDILKEHKKMKERLQYILDKVEGLKEKTYERIKFNPELAIEIERDEEPEDFGGFAHLQIVGFTAPEIFPNFLHFLTGKFGLFLKKEAGEAWFPFSDLNFLERRVIFLGLMDHLHSSFSAVLTTIRHLEEIYTPGYPMNLLTRFKPLDELTHRPKPCQLLATESKLALYGAACGCLGALKRFTSVYKELMTMVKDARVGMDKFDYSVPTCAEFTAKLGKSDKSLSFGDVHATDPPGGVEKTITLIYINKIRVFNIIYNNGGGSCVFKSIIQGLEQGEGYGDGHKLLRETATAYVVENSSNQEILDYHLPPSAHLLPEEELVCCRGLSKRKTPLNNARAYRVWMNRLTTYASHLEILAAAKIKKFSFSCICEDDENPRHYLCQDYGVKKSSHLFFFMTGGASGHCQVAIDVSTKGRNCVLPMKGPYLHDPESGQNHYRAAPKRSAEERRDDHRRQRLGGSQHALWSKYQSEEGEGERSVGYGGFPNLMRLLYYLEHINIGLPKQEMFRLALSLRQLNLTHPVKRSRFWGKVFGIFGSYYVVEAELSGRNEEDLWVAGEEESLPTKATNGGSVPNPNFISGSETYERARSAVTNPNVLIPYQETSGLPPGPINAVLPSSVPPPMESMGEGDPDPTHPG